VDQLPNADEDEVASQLSGHWGEARSSLRYANNGEDVEIDPGNGEYDLQLGDENQNPEFVEVKTRRGIPDSEWVDNQISAMNQKLENTDADETSVDATTENTALEMQTMEYHQLDEARDEILTAINTRQNTGGDMNFNEIQLTLADGTTDSIVIPD
jgi:hypothetical protein